MRFTMPKPLRPGDTVAIPALSAGAAELFPWVLEEGIRVLEDELGLVVKEMPTTRKSTEWLHKHPKARAKDLMDAFEDDDVDAIIATIGGDDSIRVLEHLDLDIIKKHPKILMGFSDTSTYTTYLNQHGLVTFNGPSVLAGFAQAEALPGSFIDHIKDVLFDAKPVRLPTFGMYADRAEDWVDKERFKQLMNVQEPLPWDWLQGEGVVEGRLWGGCIEVLDFINGTRYWPDPEFFDGKILFVETSEEVPKPDQVLWWLRNFAIQGILDRINGLLIGRPRGYDEKMREDLKRNIEKLLTIEYPAELPVVLDCEFGHGIPQWVLPLGETLRMDCENQQLTLRPD